MFRILFKLCIVFCIVSPSLPAQNVRKYNLEEEAFKLYKQDFKTVLKRFRRTTDYLKILQDRLADLKTSTREMSLQLLHYFHGKMEKKVTDTLSAQQAGISKVEDEKDKKYYRTENRDTESSQIPEDDWIKISNLESYHIFNSHLTVPERNIMKEMGYSYAGQVVHSIIGHLKPTTVSNTVDKFTQLPYGDDFVIKFTTTHPETHEVTVWQYMFDDNAKQKEEKPLQNDEKVSTIAAEPARFRASQPLPKATVKQNLAPTKSTSPRYTRKVITSIVTFAGK